MIIPVCPPTCPLRHVHTLLTVGYQLDSPLIGKGKVVSIDGDLCNIYWEHMGITQTYRVSGVIDEIRQEQKNKEKNPVDTSSTP